MQSRGLSVISAEWQNRFVYARKTGLVHKRVTTDKPEARAKEIDTRKYTSRNKRLRKWLQSLSSSLALQACRSEAVTLLRNGLNHAEKP